MRKKHAGKTHPSKSPEESLGTVHVVKQFAKVEFVKAMARSSTTSETTVEAVLITFRLALLVVDKTGVASHLVVRW
jgi:hypothetical protein